MGFILSKLIWWLANPSTLLLLLMIAGLALLWSRRRGTGRILVTISVSIGIAATFLPLGSWLLAPLENRFPRPNLPENITGIIVLGGSVQAAISKDRGVIAVNGNVERLLAFARLAKRFPKARLIFTGGSGSLFRQDAKEAGPAARLLAEIGVDRDRLEIDRAARNTVESARNLSARVPPRQRKGWVLITSARHMPRSIGVFRRAGWTVIAYPVDYRTGPSVPLLRSGGFSSGLGALDAGAREWYGLIGYWALGRTDAFFPAP